MHASEYKSLMDSSNKIYSKEYVATRQYLYSHCHNPQKIRIQDPYTHENRVIEVPCGHCLHCRAQKKNEWVTRAYAHLEYFKNCYFVTLTYRSFSSVTPVTKYIMSYLNGALWHYDNFNTKRRFGWNPCVICQEHFQNFMKRLRKNTGFDDITYMASYEYGHDFGRPHAHFILFTNHTLNINDIYDAWSIKLYVKNGVITRARNHSKSCVHRFVFGHVDFHNLVENGSLDAFNDPNKQIFVDGKNMSARHCFAYVCKYIQKKEYNTNRVKLAFNSLIRGEKTYYCGSTDAYYVEDLRDMHLSTPVEVLHDPAYTIPAVVGASQYLFTNNLKTCEFYENMCTFFGTFKVVCAYLGQIKCPVTKDVESDFSRFAEVFAPISRVSVGTPIGSLYATSHVSEFVDGKFDRPALQTDGYVLPNYFIRKAKQYLYGFRSVSKASASRSFVQGSCTAFRDDLYSLSQGMPTCVVRTISSLGLSTYDALRSSWCYKDEYSGERILFKYDSDPLKIYVEYYKYSRQIRDFCFVRSVSLGDFLKVFIERYEKSRLAYSERCQKVEDELKIRDSICDNYLGDWFELAKKCYEDIDAHIKKLDHDWNITHNHLE